MLVVKLAFVVRVVVEARFELYGSARVLAFDGRVASLRQRARLDRRTTKSERLAKRSMIKTALFRKLQRP
jgi:hypothetical protein